jgi:paraquat-inducible protein B
MTENNQSATKARVMPAKPVSMIWLIPILAVFIGSWMVYQNWRNQGPLITVEFKTASGIEVGMTKIKSLNVDIGQVIKVDIKPDLDGVIVTARLASPDYDALLRENTAFWVVSPQVTRAGISGLHTLLSGPYIELYPGSGEIEQYHFEGLETPPLTATGTPGLSVTLSSEHDFSFTAGDPIIYKGFNVGKIEDIYFNSDENNMYYNAFIEAPYHTLIRGNTRFWKMSGVELEVSAAGLKIQAGTLETIVRGGVTFGLPKGEVMGEMVEGRGYFDIYPDEQAILDERYAHKVNYLLLVEDSIRGLQIGAPVEFRGVKIGQVVRTDLAYHQINNLLDKDSLIPILIQLEPGRMGLSDDEDGVDKLKQDLVLWVEKGLKASLITGNLVTGSQLVELAYFDQGTAVSVTSFQQYPVIPLVPNKFSRIGLELGELVNKLNSLPLESVASETESVLMETKRTLAKLQKLPLESMVNNADKVFIKTDKLVDKLTRSVTTLEQILANTNDAQLPQTMNDTLRSVDAILLDLKPLLLHLKNKPNGLIFSGQVGDTIEPKKGE